MEQLRDFSLLPKILGIFTQAVSALISKKQQDIDTTNKGQRKHMQGFSFPPLLSLPVSSLLFLVSPLSLSIPCTGSFLFFSLSFSHFFSPSLIAFDVVATFCKTFFYFRPEVPEAFYTHIIALILHLMRVFLGTCEACILIFCFPLFFLFILGFFLPVFLKLFAFVPPAVASSHSLSILVVVFFSAWPDPLFPFFHQRTRRRVKR